MHDPQLRRVVCSAGQQHSALMTALAFYLARGYDEEARVRDYFETGDDMVMFRKALHT